jgi:hypothetical protein
MAPLGQRERCGGSVAVSRVGCSRSWISIGMLGFLRVAPHQWRICCRRRSLMPWRGAENCLTISNQIRVSLVIPKLRRINERAGWGCPPVSPSPSLRSWATKDKWAGAAHAACWPRRPTLQKQPVTVDCHLGYRCFWMCSEEEDNAKSYHESAIARGEAVCNNASLLRIL